MLSENISTKKYRLIMVVTLVEYTSLCTYVLTKKYILFLFLLFPADCSPNLLTLEKFPGPNGPIKILEQIAAHYQVFGLFLLNDTNGALVSAIQREYFHVPIDITRAILRQWLQTGEPSTVTWRVLVQCLRDSELNSLASEIERGLVE